MTSLVIDNAARDSMMQLTGQNWLTRSLSGSYKITNGSRVHKLFFYSSRMEGEAIKETVLRESMESPVNEFVEDGKWRWRMVMGNEFYKKPCLMFL